MTARDVVGKIKKGELSALKHLNAYLDQSEKRKNLNAFVRLLPERAQQRARDIDERIKRGGSTGALAGLVVAVKDNICIRDEVTSCGSKILEDYRPPFSATVVEKLEAQDAVIIGKTNLDEFAMGSSNENSAHGVVKNPFDESKVPGGSSGGSAVAVASGFCDVALGSETGGSIRQPASFTNTVGVKPSYGRVSRYGLVAFASSLDQIGVFASNSADAAFVLQHMAGHDDRDSTSALIDVPDYATLLSGDISGLRIGVPKEYFAHGLDEEIKQGVLKITDELAKKGASVKEISLPVSDYAIAMYYIICTAEASSNLARYDGVRYGKRVDSGQGLHEMYAATRSEGFGDEVRRRIMLGTYVLSAGYYDAYYKKALQARRLLKEQFDKAFGNVDVIASPTTPTTAFAIGEKSDDPLEMYLSDIYTVSANLAGICGISVPAGRHSNGLPYGIQLQAAAFNEETLFKTAHFIETQVTI